MNIPVTRNFNPSDIIGKFDSDTSVIEFINPEEVMEDAAIAISYSVKPEDVEEIAGTRLVKKAKLTGVSVVARKNLVYDA